MEFTTQKVIFRGSPVRVVERKNTIPILANVGPRRRFELRARPRGGPATFCAAEVRSAGSVTLAARKLTEIGRALPEAAIRFRVSPTGLRSSAKAVSHGGAAGGLSRSPRPRFDDGVRSWGDVPEDGREGDIRDDI